MEVKIDQKSIKKWSQDGKTSWDRFLVDFGGFLGPSWEGKIQPRQAKTGQDRPRQAKTREGKGRERKGRGSERTGRGKVWKSVAREICRWGGGVHPPLGGDSRALHGFTRSLRPPELSRALQGSPGLSRALQSFRGLSNAFQSSPELSTALQGSPRFA